MRRQLQEPQHEADEEEHDERLDHVRERGSVVAFDAGERLSGTAREGRPTRARTMPT